MKANQLVVCAAVAVAMCAGVNISYAQDWTGPYVGGPVGFGMQLPNSANKIVLFDKTLDGVFGDTVTTVAGVNAFSPGFCDGDAVNAMPASGCTKDDRGADYGVRGGYDWQIGRLVFGAVGELSRTEQRSSVSAFSTTPAFYTLTRELDWLTGVRGRAGYGTDRVLIYGTGGVAWANVDHSFTTSNVVNTFVQLDNAGAWGYQAGGGMELRLGGRWSFGAEYLMTSLRDKDKYSVRAQGPAPATNAFILTNPAGTDFRRADQFEFYALRLTTGYRF